MRLLQQTHGLFNLLETVLCKGQRCCEDLVKIEDAKAITMKNDKPAMASYCALCSLISYFGCPTG